MPRRPRNKLLRASQERRMNFSSDTPNKEGFRLMPRRRTIIRSIVAAALFTLAGTNV